MNTIKLLLIIGLGSFAFFQKSLKTRNMLLVITGLLAFCMFSVEGFAISKSNFNDIFGSEEVPASPNQSVENDDNNNMIVTGSDSNVYTFSKDDDMTESNVTCKINGHDGNVSLKEDATESTTATDISSFFNCEPIEPIEPIEPTEPEKTKCSDAPKDIKKCPDYYSINEDKFCASKDCEKDDFRNGACCSETCDESDCKINFFGRGDGKECEKSYFSFLYKYKCKEDDED